MGLMPDGLAQVEGKVLTASAALAPDIGNPRRARHDRDTDAGSEPVHARENRVFANECDGASGVFGTESELGHHGAEARVDVEACSRLWCG